MQAGLQFVLRSRLTTRKYPTWRRRPRTSVANLCCVSMASRNRQLSRGPRTRVGQTTFRFRFAATRHLIQARLSTGPRTVSRCGATTLAIF